MKKRAALLLFAAMTLTSCRTSGGDDRREETLAQIEVGVTNQDQVRDWFGAPDAMETSGMGGAHWTYVRRESPGWSAPLANAFIAVVEAVIVFVPPTQPRGDADDDVREVLRFEFAPTGVVRKYSHERYEGRPPL